MNIVRVLTSPKMFIQYRAYAATNSVVAATTLKKRKAVGGSVGGGIVADKKLMSVETDAERLVKYCCGSNIFKTGEDVKIRSDDEYPSWLWDLNVDRAPTLEELDPNTKQYWLKVRKINIKRNNLLRSIRRWH